MTTGYRLASLEFSDRGRIPNALGTIIYLRGTLIDGRSFKYPIVWSDKDGEISTGREGIELGIGLAQNALGAVMSMLDDGTIDEVIEVSRG